MRIRQPEHAVRDAAAELARAAIDLAGVQFREVAGQAGEADQIGFGDGAAGAAKGHPDMQVGIDTAGPSLFGHRSILDTQDLQARMADAGGR